MLEHLDPHQAALDQATQLARSRGEAEVVGPAVVGIAAGSVVRVRHPAQARARARTRATTFLGCSRCAHLSSIGEVRDHRSSVVCVTTFAARGQHGRRRWRASRRRRPHTSAIAYRNRRRTCVRRPGGQRVGPGGHGLGAKRLSGPAGGHLSRDHAAHVVLDVERVDGLNAPRTIGPEHEITAVLAAQAGQRQRPGSRHVERGRKSQRLGGAVLQYQLAGRQTDRVGGSGVQRLPSRPVGPAEAGRPVLEQHPDDVRGADRSEARALVVVGQDPLIAPVVCWAYPRVPYWLRPMPWPSPPPRM